MEKIEYNLDKYRQPPKQKFQSTPHQQLAAEIAEDFNDVKHIGVYMRICKQYPDSFVRGVWATVKEIGPRNPGAYFTKLIYKK